MGKALDFVRRGTRSEYLAQFAFSMIAFVVPVPRQEDFFLTDFFVHLNAPVGEGRSFGFAPLGHTLAVQVKSSDAPIALKVDEVRLLAETRIPWFIAVCNPERSHLRIFSTIDRLWFRKWDEPITITFDVAPRTLDGMKRIPKNTLPIGPCIADVSLSELDSPDDGVRQYASDLFRNVIRTYTVTDAINIAELDTYNCMIVRPRTVNTNVPVSPTELEPAMPLWKADTEKLAYSAALRIVVLRQVLKAGSSSPISFDARAQLRKETSELLTLLKAAAP